MFVRNKKTGSVVPAGPHLIARAKRDEGLEVLEALPGRPAPKRAEPTPEPTPEPDPEPIDLEEVDTRLNINLATAEMLAETIDGVGEATARSIRRRIEVKGPFKRLGDMAAVSGVGKKTVNKNRHKLKV